MTKKKKKQEKKKEYTFHIERKLVHGQMVNVKVYEPEEIPDDTYVIGAMGGELTKLRETFFGKED